MPNTPGVWHAYEQYVKFSATAGKGIFRFWQDGKLIFEDKITPTLASSSQSDFIYLFTYWNNNAPATQSLYIDDAIVTNERPNNTDAAGNPFIGVGNATFTATYCATKPPINSRLNIGA